MTDARWPDPSGTAAVGPTHGPAALDGTDATAEPAANEPTEPTAVQPTGPSAAQHTGATGVQPAGPTATVPTGVTGDQPNRPTGPTVVSGDGPGQPAGGTSGPTGQPAVDAALAQLDAVADRPPAEQVAAFEAAHRALTATLSSIDQS